MRIPTSCPSSGLPQARTPRGSSSRSGDTGLALSRWPADALAEARAALGGTAPDAIGHGPDGLIDVATHPDADVVLFASSGTAGLEAVLAAIDAGKTIALANKEVLVMAGALVIAAARRRGVAILPSTASTTRSTSACTAGALRKCDASCSRRRAVRSAIFHGTSSDG